MADVKDPLLPQAKAITTTTTTTTKSTAMQDANMATQYEKMARQSRQHKFQIAAFVFLLSLFWMARSWNSEHEHLEVDTKVPLEIHIMSKCPDARDCMQKLIVPTMEEVADKVNFTMSFIGTPSPTDDDVQCLHGPSECLGNILMLCAATTYPDPKLHLGFSNCLLADYAEIPARSLAEDCALEHGLDFDTLNECMSRDSGGYGMGLLRDSVLRSQEVKARTSCTVRLAGKVRCVFDGGEWRDCEGGERPGDLIADIKRLYDEARGWTY
ncbi:hypothetical protein LEMA_P036010.1 [Plenodomus lingam JN3]|uniref:Gamma interferon inducible lysosomal thiol reductase (GILT) n=2 Tax=Leptosphaeria maculans TaxID=5022 RepID=E4ZRT0_LEPMJ|nr:hypothetical protein LEMA_P036010.1 [Plenodomus lingam JN3]CBX93927.1 hypothetical protein LEMA_P036010.1 [Plenodomus lingam JN3]